MPSVRKRYELPVKRARVFAAWLSNDSVIAPVTRIDIQPEVGGHYRLKIGDAPDAPTMDGRVLAIEPDRYVRYTWRWGSGPESTVDVRFDDMGDGTAVRIDHSGFADSADAERHSSGWDSYVSGLKALLAA